MEDKILVNLSADHVFECTTDIIGREGEGGITRLEITIPNKLSGCSVYLDFEKPNGEKFRTPKLSLENGKAVYDVAQYLLMDDGEINVQAVLITSDGRIWKSSDKRYIILNSINATEQIPVIPVGTIQILTNGTHDVTGYARAEVNVPTFATDITDIDTEIDKLNAIIGGGNEVTLISFTIEGTTYQAEEGMTWKAWCASAYNTGGYINVSGADGVYYGDTAYMVETRDNDEYILVEGQELIISGQAYYHWEYVTDATVTITNTSTSYDADVYLYISKGDEDEDPVIATIPKNSSATITVPIGSIIYAYSTGGNTPSWANTSTTGDITYGNETMYISGDYKINGDGTIVGYARDAG